MDGQANQLLWNFATSRAKYITVVCMIISKLTHLYANLNEFHVLSTGIESSTRQQFSQGRYAIRFKDQGWQPIKSTRLLYHCNIFIELKALLLGNGEWVGDACFLGIL